MLSRIFRRTPPTPAKQKPFYLEVDPTQYFYKHSLKGVCFEEETAEMLKGLSTAELVRSESPAPCAAFYQNPAAIGAPWARGPLNEPVALVCRFEVRRGFHVDPIAPVTHQHVARDSLIAPLQFREISKLAPRGDIACAGALLTEDYKLAESVRDFANSQGEEVSAIVRAIACPYGVILVRENEGYGEAGYPWDFEEVLDRDMRIIFSERVLQELAEAGVKEPEQVHNICDKLGVLATASKLRLWPERPGFNTPKPFPIHVRRPFGDQGA